MKRRYEHVAIKISFVCQAYKTLSSGFLIKFFSTRSYMTLGAITHDNGANTFKQ